MLGNTQKATDTTVWIQSFLQLEAIVVRCPMERQNPRTLSSKNRPVRRGAASRAPQPRGIAEPPPRTEEDHSAGRAPRWEDQWLQFLERVKSDEMLEDEALWGEAKVLLASLGPETEACRSLRHEWAVQHAEVTLGRLPQEWQSWLRERSLQNRSQVLALAEAYLSRRYDSWEWEHQVAAGSSSSALHRNPPDPRQEEEGQQSLLAWLLSDSENEGDQLGTWLEGDEEETLRGWESSRGQEGNIPTEEERMDQLMPCLGGALQAQEQPTEGSGDRSPGTQNSTNTQEELSNASGCETPSAGGKRFLCSECGKRFAWGFQVTSHQRIHTGEKPFQCSECEKRFRHGKGLHGDRLVHPGERPAGLMPDSANEGDQPGTLLERDEEDTPQGWERLRGPEEEPIPGLEVKVQEEETEGSINAEEGPNIPLLPEESPISTPGGGALGSDERPYLCEDCGRGFVRRDRLMEHRKVHTGEKPYACDECGKRFAWRHGLAMHKKTHTGEKPHQCPYCQKSFADKSNFRKHQKNPHRHTLSMFNVWKELQAHRNPSRT